MVEFDDLKVSFKTAEEAKKEKIESAGIQKIEYSNTEGIYIAERLFATTANVFTGKFSNSKKKGWFYIIYEKNVKVGVIFEEGSSKPNAGNTSTVVKLGSASYFFGKAKSDNLVFGFFKSAGKSLAIGTDSLIRKMSKEAFSDCPKLIEIIDKEDFKADTVIDQLTIIFEKIKCK